MASLMQVLIDTLDKEQKEYVTLLDLSKRKTPIIVEGNVEKLQTITDEEQVVIALVGQHSGDAAAVRGDGSLHQVAEHEGRKGVE